MFHKKLSSETPIFHFTIMQDAYMVRMTVPFLLHMTVGIP